MKVSVSYLPDMFQFQAYPHLDKSKHVCISDADVLFCTRNPDSIMHQAGLRLLEGGGGECLVLHNNRSILSIPKGGSGETA